MPSGRKSAIMNKYHCNMRKAIPRPRLGQQQSPRGPWPKHKLPPQTKRGVDSDPSFLPRPYTPRTLRHPGAGAVSFRSLWQGGLVLAPDARRPALPTRPRCEVLVLQGRNHGLERRPDPHARRRPGREPLIFLVPAPGVTTAVAASTAVTLVVIAVAATALGRPPPLLRDALGELREILSLGRGG